MLTGQMGKYKCVFEMSAEEMRLMVIVIYGLDLQGADVKMSADIS